MARFDINDISDENKVRKEKLNKILKYISIFLFIGLIIGGVVFISIDERDHLPNYVIRDSRTIYYTDTFTVDSNNCIHFKDVERNLFRIKERDVEVCGYYTIESKWKR
jgi:hypothetical protein